ncbi:hypothetical protein TNCV_4934801 [Trichonephila clavipes]|uniref:Uncharacterized protein n=1 Tax=Trichonephila clavipes TaxID=2585209 RepID=A0A8X6SFB8_TRICX|nr:hypothetical protein TNCV_4934801 [Trichonephila clavipes]
MFQKKKFVTPIDTADFRRVRLGFEYIWCTYMWDFPRPRSYQRTNERRGKMSQRGLDAQVGNPPLLKQIDQPGTGRVGTSCPMFKGE